MSVPIIKHELGKWQIRNRLRVILADKEKTNRWLAAQMGVTEMTVSRWTTNKIQPSMAQFVALSHLLQVDLHDLLEDDLEIAFPTGGERLHS